MVNFIHRWLNPHCEHCKEERDEARHCNSCEILQMEIERLRLENQRLLDSILKESPKIEEPEPLTINKPIARGFVPRRVQMQMLEKEDREKARLIKELNERDKKLHAVEKKDRTVEDMEKELGVINET